MIPEELLKQAAEEAEQAMADQIPEEAEHTFSAEFEEKMRKLREKAGQPKVYPFLRRAACAVLALCLLGGVLMLNTEVRAAVVGWVSKQYQNFCLYSVDTSLHSQIKNRYAPTWLPDGYAQTDTMVNTDTESIVYKTDDGPMVLFTYSYGGASVLYIEGDTREKQQININGNIADLYPPSVLGDNSIIVWYDLENNVILKISSACDLDILIKIAESVKIIH